MKQVADGANTYAAPNGAPAQGTMNYDTSLALLGDYGPDSIVELS